jgi:hypothetical protein
MGDTLNINNQANYDYDNVLAALHDLEAKKSQSTGKKFYICLDSTGRLAAVDSRHIISERGYKKLSIAEIAQVANLAIQNLPKDSADKLQGEKVKSIHQRIAKLIEERASKVKAWRLLHAVITVFLSFLAIAPGVAFYRWSKPLHIDTEGLKNKFEREFAKTIQGQVKDLQKQLHDGEESFIKTIQPLITRRNDRMTKAVAERWQKIKAEGLTEGKAPDLKAVTEDIEKEFKVLDDEIAHKISLESKRISDELADHVRALSLLPPLTKDLTKEIKKVSEHCSSEGVESRIKARLQRELPSINDSLKTIAKKEYNELEQELSNQLNRHAEALYSKVVPERQAIIDKSLDKLKKDPQVLARIQLLVKEGKPPLEDDLIKSAMATILNELKKALKDNDAVISNYYELMEKQLKEIEGRNSVGMKFLQDFLKQDAEYHSFKDFKKYVNEKVNKLVGDPPEAQLQGFINGIALSLRPELSALSKLNIEVRSNDLTHFQGFDGMGYYLKKGFVEDGLIDVSYGIGQTVAIPKTGNKDLNRGLYGNMVVRLADGEILTHRNFSGDELYAGFCNALRNKIGDEAMQRFLFLHMQGAWEQVAKPMNIQLNTSNGGMNNKYAISQPTLEESSHFTKPLEVSFNKDGDMHSISQTLLVITDTTTDPIARCFVVAIREVFINGKALNRNKTDPLTNEDLAYCRAKCAISQPFASIQEAEAYNLAQQAALKKERAV